MSEQTDEYKQDPVQAEQTVDPSSDNVAAKIDADRGDDDVNDKEDNRPATAINETANKVPEKDDVSDPVNDERVQQSVHGGGNDDENNKQAKARNDTANNVLQHDDVAKPVSEERIEENINEDAQDDIRDDKSRKSRKGKNKVHPSVETVSEYANQELIGQGRTGPVPNNDTNATTSGKSDTNRQKPSQSETTTDIDEDTKRVMYTRIYLSSHEMFCDFLGHRSRRLQWPIVIMRCPSHVVRRPSSVVR